MDAGDRSHNDHAQPECAMVAMCHPVADRVSTGRRLLNSVDAIATPTPCQYMDGSGRSAAWLLTFKWQARFNLNLEYCSGAAPPSFRRERHHPAASARAARH